LSPTTALPSEFCGVIVLDSPETLVRQVHEWWTTSIIDVHPGEITIRGYDVRDLIGSVTFPDMVWLLLRGELPTTSQSALLEAALVSAVDHGPHAPSIATSRMAVSCGLSLNGAVASAVNMLDDVHGGAGQQCMELYADVRAALKARGGVGDDEQAVLAATENVIADWRARGVTYLPGYGHRFHPVDPRSGRLLGLVDDAAKAGAVSGEYATIGRCVESVLARGRPAGVPMNVDGATAVVYSELGFPPQLGRGLFILSRSVGILAHAWEQSQQGGRIKGPMPPSIPFRYTGEPARTLPDPRSRQRLDATDRQALTGEQG
jgi:citrate synthase